MSRGYSSGKRSREEERSRKKREKAERRRQKRDRGVVDIPVTTAEAITGHLPTSEEAMHAMEERAAAPRHAAKIPGRLFVGRLSDNVTEDDLTRAFEVYGKVLDVVVAKDRDTGAPRGFGFVTLADRKDAARALQGEEIVIDGRALHVDVATERDR